MCKASSWTGGNQDEQHSTVFLLELCGFRGPKMSLGSASRHQLLAAQDRRLAIHGKAFFTVQPNSASCAKPYLRPRWRWELLQQQKVMREEFWCEISKIMIYCATRLAKRSTRSPMKISLPTKTRKALNIYLFSFHEYHEKSMNCLSAAYQG
jgi:hypothetical protein